MGRGAQKKEIPFEDNRLSSGYQLVLPRPIPKDGLAIAPSLPKYFVMREALGIEKSIYIVWTGENEIYFSMEPITPMELMRLKKEKMRELDVYDWMDLLIRLEQEGYEAFKSRLYAYFW